MPGSHYQLPGIEAVLSPSNGDSWTATSNTGAPSARNAHAAVWTGNEMIVWAGFDGVSVFNTGGRYTFTVTQGSLASVSAASFLSAEMAPDSIVAAFGQNLATATEPAATLPLPTTLAGASVRPRDSAGVDPFAILFGTATARAVRRRP